MKTNIVQFPLHRVRHPRIAGHLITTYCGGGKACFICMDGMVIPVDQLEAAEFTAKYGIFPARAGKAEGAL